MSEPEAAAQVPTVGSGDVEITLLSSGGQPEKLVLRPSYAAARALSGQAGGLLGAGTRLMNLDLDLAVMVITLGLGYGSNRMPPEDLGERIYKTGLGDRGPGKEGLASACTRYVANLMRGGRPAEDDPKN